VVFRTPPPVQLLGRLAGGAYRAVPTSEGPPDYVLLLAAAPAPVPVALEAKDCAGSRWALKQLHPHQGDALARWHSLHGLAAVALRHQPSSTCWLLPWGTLGPLWQRWRAGQVAGQPAPRGSASLGLGDLHQLGTSWAAGDGDSYLRALLACAPRTIVGDR
jgi:hypothetical protein